MAAQCSLHSNPLLRKVKPCESTCDSGLLENINLIADSGKNFLVIMKDGKVYKNALAR